MMAWSPKVIGSKQENPDLSPGSLVPGPSRNPWASLPSRSACLQAGGLADDLQRIL